VVNRNLFFVFKILKREAIRSFLVVSYFFIHVNSEFDVRMQSVTRAIV